MLNEGFTVEQGGKHLRVLGPSGTLVATLSTTGRSGRQWANERAQLRRVGALGNRDNEGGNMSNGVAERGWTREASVAALQRWAEAHGGRAPRQHELGRRADPPLPSTHHLKEFGGLRAVVVEAGLPPAPMGNTKASKGAGVVADATVAATAPEPVVEQVVAVQVDPPGTTPTQLAKLAEDLELAEQELARLRGPYIKARDDAQLIRMEMIELLQKGVDPL